MSGYRCCRHCAEDPTHDPEDRHQHQIPCGGSNIAWYLCPDGGGRFFTPSNPFASPEDWCDLHDDWYDDCGCYV